MSPRHLPSVTGASPSDRFTLAAEFATRNIAVATASAVTLAGRVEFALFATTYFLTGAPLMVGAIIVFRRLRQRHVDDTTDERDPPVSLRPTKVTIFRPPRAF